MFSVKQTEIVPCQISVMTFQRFWLVSRLPVKIHVAVQTSCGQSTPLLEPPLIILWFLVELKKKPSREWLWTSSNCSANYINNKWQV